MSILPGSKVRVRSYEEISSMAQKISYNGDLRQFYTRPDGEQDSIWFTHRMKQWCGKEFTVSKIDKIGLFELKGVAEDDPDSNDSDWSFLEDWLEPVTQYVVDFDGTVESSKKEELREVLKQLEDLTEKVRKLLGE